MKKSLFSLLALLGFFTVVLISCDEEDDGIDLIPPTINKPDDAALEVGAMTDLSFDINTPGGFQSASVSSSSSDIATAEITSQLPSSSDSDGTIVVTVTGVAAGETTITLAVTDNEAQDATSNVVITVEETIPVMPTIGDTIPDFEDLSTLAAALEATDLDEVLNGEGPFTVFAPNNEAFDALLEALELEDVPAVVGALGEEGISQLLQAHVISGDSLGAAELSDGQELTTVNDSTITIGVNGDAITVNGASVVTADIVAGNGVIHVIDSVINLPDVGVEEDMENAGTALGDIDDLSSLNAAVDVTGLTDDLDNADQVTIFAPNNDAIQALLDDQGIESLDALVEALTEEGLAGVLQAHVVADSLTSTEAAAAAGGDSLATLNPDEMIGITSDDEGNLYVNGAMIVEADIMVANGVIHIIDSVINLPEGIEGTMTNAGSALGGIDDLSTLNAAVDATDLTDDLDNAEQVTIFAPNNAAFQALLDDQGLETLDDLIEALTADGVAGVLQAHVVADSLGATEVVAAAGADSLQTLNMDEKLGITMDGDMVYVNGAQVLETDILAGNGVIHVIDSVVNLP